MHPVLIEAAEHFSRDSDLSSVDENTSRELRGRIERAMDEYHSLSLTVGRIDERMSTINETLAKVISVTEQMAELKHAVEMKRLEHQELRAAEERHQSEIERIGERLKQVDMIEDRLKTLSWGWRLIIGFMISIFVAMVGHIFIGK